MGSAEITQFLSHLAVQKESASTQNQATSAIVFLYKAVLKEDPGESVDMIWAKRSKKLPSLLTRFGLPKRVSCLR